MDMLAKLCSINAVSANEENLAKAIEEELKGYADEITTDCLGNVIAHKKGNKNRIMITARMDEAGGVVTYVHENGNIRFCTVGECDTVQLVNVEVVFKNGARGVIRIDEGKNLSDVKTSDLFVALEENSGNVGISDVFSFCSENSLTDDTFKAKSAGVRSGVSALISAMKELKDTDNDIYAVFTSRSQVGFKGVKTAAEGILPEMAFCIGEVEESGNIKCGNGVVINLKGANFICDKTLLERVRDIAHKNEISYVYNVSKDVLTEGGIVKKVGEGVKAFEISIPVKHKNKPCQSVNKKDIVSMTELIKLIAEFI